MNIAVEGSVYVEQILTALGLNEIPEGCELTLDDEVEITVTADAHCLRDEVDEMFDDEPEGLPLEHLRDAVAALRKGDTATALTLFSHVFGGSLSREMPPIEDALLSRRAA